MNQAQKDIKKHLLDIDKQRKIKEAEDRFADHNNNGRFLSEKGLIEAEYVNKKRLIDEEPENEPTKDLPNVPAIVVVSKEVLKWDAFTLNIKDGRATIGDKSHTFQIGKRPFLCFELLLKKRISGIGDGEVTFVEIMKSIDIKDKDSIKQVIRNLRRNLGINRNSDQAKDVFQPTGRGYKLVSP